MESLASLLRMLIDSSWRVGIPLAIAGAAILGLHRFGLPEPGVLIAYLGWATVAFVTGLSFTLVSAVAGVLSAIQRATYQRRVAREAVVDLKANVSSLTPEEFILLGELLEGGAIRMKVHRLSNAYSLLEKGVLVPVGGNSIEPMCEIPKELREHKADILAQVPRARTMLRGS